MPAWIFGGTKHKQRTKRFEKSASEGDMRIHGNSGGSLQTIETGSDFPIGIIRWDWKTLTARGGSFQQALDGVGAARQSTTGLGAVGARHRQDP